MSGVGGCPVCDVDSDDATKGAWWLGMLGFALAAPAATERAAGSVDRMLVFDLEEIADLLRRGWEPHK